MSERDDLSVPSLGGAERDEAMHPVPGNRNASRAQPQPEKNSGSWVPTIVMVLLTGATSALGYWGYGLHLQLAEQAGQFEQQTKQMAEQQARLEQLESLLEVSRDKAQQSGQTLGQRLDSVEKTLSGRTKHVDSEIDKLWGVAYRSNKPKLEKLESTLAAQQKEFKALQGVRSELSKLSKGEAAQTKQLKTLSAELEAGLAGLDKRITGISQALDAQQEAVVKLTRDTRDRLNVLESQNSAVDMRQRISSNEKAIQAIDGSRVQINRSLLQVRQQLNSLQLKLEQNGIR